MSVRIIIERQETALVVRVYGRLVGTGALDEFLRVCEPASAALIIDLSELRFADEAALRVLRSLRDTGAQLCGVSPYISLLMRS